MDGQDNGKTSGVRVLGELRNSADRASLTTLVEFVSSRARELGFSDKRVQEIEAAMAEALNNILERTFAEVASHIDVTCNVDHRERFVVVITDDGKAFNMLLSGTRFFGDEEDRHVSTGTMKKMIDDIEYKRVDNTNVLTFIAGKDARSKA